MIKYLSVLFVVGLYALAVVRVQAKTEDEKMECEMCSSFINDSCGMLKNMFKKMEPIAIENPPPPCSSCVFRGASTMQSTKEVCSKKCPNKADTYDNELNLQFQGMSIECTCTIPKCPAKVAKLLADKASNPVGGVPCKNPPDASVVQPVIPTMTPDKILTLKSCQPQISMPAAAPKLPGKRAAADDCVTGKITATWTSAVNIKVVMSATKGIEHVTAKHVDLLTKDTKDVVNKCDGEDAFKAPCACLCEAEFIKIVLVQAVQLLFPCYAEAETKKKQYCDIAKSLSCIEYQ